MFETITTIINAAVPYISAVTGVVAAASAITAITPTKTDDNIINAVLKVLNFLAVNIGKNTNADA